MTRTTFPLAGSAPARIQKPGRSSRAPGAPCHDDGIGIAFDQTRQTDLAVKLRGAPNVLRTKRAIAVLRRALMRCKVFFRACRKSLSAKMRIV